MAAARKLVGKVSPETTMLFVCDIQQRFIPLINNNQTVVQTARYMTDVAKALSIPMIVTEQYTKVFGPTVPEVFSNPEEDLHGKHPHISPIFEKKIFSMMTPEVNDHLSNSPSWKSCLSCILVGAESHVCVQQTALDLLEQGKDVHIIVDGVGSQQPLDREISLQRMAQAGAYLTTSQSMAFMLMKSANHPNFKTVSKLTVEHMKLFNEFDKEKIQQQQQQQQQQQEQAKTKE